MSMNTVMLEELMVRGQPSLDPRNSPTEEFELYSIPAYDNREPEHVLGSEVGSSKKIVEPGDLLLSRIVPHIRRAWVVPPCNGKRQIASGEWIVFRHKSFEPRYLRHFVMGDHFHAQFMNTVAGVGGSLVRARPENVGRIEVSLPPLLEQKRIADILDKADAIRRKRQEAIDLLNKVVRSDFLVTSGDPFTNPKGHPTLTLDKLFDIRTGKLDANAAVEGGRYPFFTCSREDYAIDTFAFDCEALLLAGNNASADYSVKHYKGKFNAYQRTYVLRLKDESHSYSFFRQLLEHKLNELKHNSRGTNTKYLTLEFFKRFELPVPPMNIQLHFDRVEECRSAANKRLVAAWRESDDLFNSLVQRAFKGEL